MAFNFQTAKHIPNDRPYSISISPVRMVNNRLSAGILQEAYVLGHLMILYHL
jgi:hypothetical protein